MSDTICVIIPVLGRPARAAAVAASVREASGPNTFAVFVCSPGDDEQIAACHQTGADVILAPFEAGPGDYARKINLAARSVQADWYFTGADDLEFTAGWDAVCIAAAHRRIVSGVDAATGSEYHHAVRQDRPVALVVGTNDDCNVLTADGRHSTHSLVHFDWLGLGTADESGLILHEGYDHQFVDTELVATAKARGLYAHADAIVRHHHPIRRRASMDDTYRKGQRGSVADARLFRRRRPLWERRPA